MSRRTATLACKGILAATLCLAACDSNEGPAVMGSIPNQTVAVGETVNILLDQYFSDPDGDDLSYEVGSSLSGVATASASGASLTVAAVSQGTATVTVTATDPGGLSAEQSFTVTVPNRAPQVADTIPGQQLFRSDSAMVGVAPYFSDPDGDPLTFEAASSDTSVATVSVSGDAVTVLALAQGSTAVTVTATDPGGLSAEQSFTVTVPNRAPQVADTIPGQQLFRSDSAMVGVAPYFSDPDGDPLTFEAASSDTSVATVSVSGDAVTVLALAQGSTAVTVTATDPGGLSAEQSFTVTVPNRAPQVADTIPGQQLFRSDSAMVGVAPYFSDPDDDPLTFEAASSDTSVATVSVSGDTVTVLALAQGSTAVTVTATDPGGLSAEQSFTVTVPNRSPVVSDSIADQELSRGAKVTLDMAAHFDDPDGDSLTFEAASSDSAVALVPVSDGSVKVSALALGVATITVTATDPGGLSVSQTFEVTVQRGDREALEALYRSTNGDGWYRNWAWLTDSPLNDWTGVRTDPGSGRVTALELGANNLVGPIPPEIGDLDSLKRLDLNSNPLTGEIPPEIGNIGGLEALFLIDNPRLTGSIPPELGKLSNLKWLSLYRTELIGRIPPEIGGLTSLENLTIGINYMSGPIPPEIGNLANLEELSLGLTGITGPLPPELGNLTKLEYLALEGNATDGPIPPELGNLTNLKSLYIHFNRLTGEIPPELGNLASLEGLWGYENELTGPLPPELGNLENLRELRLFDNDLSGPVPAEFKGLRKLRELRLMGNSKMGGPLPDSLTALEDMEILQAGGTGLCAPRTRDFREWLEGVDTVRIAFCGGQAAYLTQAVQSHGFPVPLVAGERALLRVFLTANEENDEDLPGVMVRLYEDDDEIHSKYVAGKSGPIPETMDEGDLEKSVNYEIPAGMIREDIEMVIEVDSVDASLGVPRRIPEEGRTRVEVDSMPTVRLTMIPFLWTSDPDSSIIDLVSDVAEEPMEHELLYTTRTLLPVAEADVVAHAPVESSSNNAFDLLRRTRIVRIVEGRKGYYMGTMPQPVTGAIGVAFVPGRSSFSVPDSVTIAHELGHNMSLHHAPCGGAAGPDPYYPYPDGRIGAWGWDFEKKELVDPSTKDMMSYCGPPWIGEYHFTKAATFVLSDVDEDTLQGPPRPSLLLWGGVREDGTPFLEPAFVVDAPPTLPESAGDYRLEGLRADGTELFSLNFGMLDVADAEGAAGFAFALPTGPGWSDALARIRLSGPAGFAAMDLETRRPMAILRDRATGEVRAFLDRPPADTSGLQVHFSRGIPGPEAWR